MNSLSKNLYLLKRFANSLFTKDCISCGKAVRGSCLCEKCIEKSSPSGNYRNGFACAFYYEGPAKDALLRFKFGSDYEFCFDTFCDWLLAAYEKLEEKDFDAVVPVPAFECKSTRLSELAEKFPEIDAEEILENAKPFEKPGLLKISGTKISFTPKGFLISNALTAEILY